MLAVANMVKALAFYEQALGFTRMYVNEQNGHIVHAELALGDTIVLQLTPEGLHDARVRTPSHLGTPPSCTFSLYVAHVDDMFAQALTLGATCVFAPHAMPWGERMGQIEDPDGYRWLLCEVTA